MDPRKFSSLNPDSLTCNVFAACAVWLALSLWQYCPLKCRLLAWSDTDRAFVIQCKTYLTWSLCTNMERFNFITGLQHSLHKHMMGKKNVLSDQTGGLLSGQHLSLAGQMTCLLTKIICRLATHQIFKRIAVYASKQEIRNKVKLNFFFSNTDGPTRLRKSLMASHTGEE